MRQRKRTWCTHRNGLPSQTFTHWNFPYLVVQVVFVDVIFVDVQSQVCTNSIDMDWFELSGLVSCFLIVWQWHVAVNIESKLCLATWQKMCWVFDPFALHNTKQTFTQRKQWKTKKSKRSIFTILTGLLHSRLPYIIDHHKHLRCFIHLYNRMTTQVLAFL